MLWITSIISENRSETTLTWVCVWLQITLLVSWILHLHLGYDADDHWHVEKAVFSIHLQCLFHLYQIIMLKLKYCLNKVFIHNCFKNFTYFTVEYYLHFSWSLSFKVQVGCFVNLTLIVFRISNNGAVTTLLQSNIFIEVNHTPQFKINSSPRKLCETAI